MTNITWFQLLRFEYLKDVFIYCDKMKSDCWSNNKSKVKIGLQI